MGAGAGGSRAAGGLHLAHETLNNAVRHGAPRRIVLTLAQSDGDASLTIEDAGHRRRAGDESGLGLHIMDHRASMIGGSLDGVRGIRNARSSCTAHFPAKD